MLSEHPFSWFCFCWCLPLFAITFTQQCAVGSARAFYSCAKEQLKRQRCTFHWAKSGLRRSTTSKEGDVVRVHKVSLTQSHTQRHIDKQGRRRNTDRVASFDVRRFLFLILLPLKFLFLARMAAKMVFTAGLDLSVELHSNYPSFLFLWIAVVVSAHVANTHVYTYIYTY